MIHKILELLERTSYKIHSKWFNWRNIESIDKFTKCRSIAEVDGTGSAVIAAMMINRKIRIGTIIITDIHELKPTMRYCLVALASCGVEFKTIYSSNKILFLLEKSKIRIIWKKTDGALGGSDLVICAFPTSMQINELKGDSYLVTHTIMDLEEKLNLVKQNDSYQQYKKKKRIQKTIRWGTNKSKIIGARTARERELCQRN